MRLLIFISFLGVTSSSRCIYQPRTRRVTSGGSVTIPCSYSKQEDLSDVIQIIWAEHNGENCAYDNKRIFTLSGNVTEKYEGRLIRGKDPTMTWMEYITITELKPTDGPRICCLIYNTRYEIFLWDLKGTFMQFSDTEYVTQLDELMAVSGEAVTIPCYYSKKFSEDTDVIWYFPNLEKHICRHNQIFDSNSKHQPNRYSLVNFTLQHSLGIQNVQQHDYQSYCCVVYAGKKIKFSKQFTRLLVADYKSSWDHPTEEIPVQEGQSVNLTCSYSLSGRYTERDVLRVNVYWRVGNVTGPYASHPYQEMVHPTYIHRTYITGRTHLMIKDVTRADNTSFHCFVVVKLCAGENLYEDKIQYGGGTRLIIKDQPSFEEFHPDEDRNLTFPDLIMIIVISSVTVLIVIIIMVLIILKLKGVICKKKNSSCNEAKNTIQGDVTSEEAPYCEINTKPEHVLMAATDEEERKEVNSGQMEDGEDSNIFYAQLNKTKLKRPSLHVKQNEEVVYAAVVKTSTE